MIITAKPVSLMDAFVLLVKSAFSTKPFNGATTLRLEKHPFGLRVEGPSTTYEIKRIYYVGEPGFTDSVDFMLRILGQHIGAFASDGVLNIWHLRKILCGNDKGHDIYYEIAFLDLLFICGGCTDCSGAGGSGRDTMDGVFNFLSETHGIVSSSVEFEGPPAGSQQMLNAFLRVEGQRATLDPPTRDKHHFAPGQKVRMSKFGREMHAFSNLRKADKDGIFTIDRVESIPYRCTCGLGDEVHAELHVAPCSRMERAQAMHHQFLYVRIDGATERLSGAMFEPVT